MIGAVLNCGLIYSKNDKRETNKNFINQHTTNLISFCGKKIPQQTVDAFKKFIKDADELLISGHKEPDSDSWNAMLLFKNLIKKLSPKTKIKLVSNYDIIKECKSLFSKTKIVKTDEIKNINSKTKFLIVDHSSEQRADQNIIALINKVPNPDEQIFVFDHHPIKKGFIPIKGASYIDPEATSTSELGFDFYELLLGKNPTKKIIQSSYMGALDDLIRSGTAVTKKNGNKYELIHIETPEESVATIKKMEKVLPRQIVQKVLKSKDILSNINTDQKEFLKKLYKNTKISTNGKVAYAVIDNNDWQKIGGKTEENSFILSNWRIQLSRKDQSNELIPEILKDKLDKIETVMVFFPGKNEYEIAIRSEAHKATEVSEKLKQLGYNAGGPNDTRAGVQVPFDLVNTQEKLNNFIKGVIGISEKL